MKQIKHINIMKKEYLTPLSKILPVFGRQAVLGASTQEYEAVGGDTGYGYDPDSD